MELSCAPLVPSPETCCWRERQPGLSPLVPPPSRLLLPVEQKYEISRAQVRSVLEMLQGPPQTGSNQSPCKCPPPQLA